MKRSSKIKIYISCYNYDKYVGECIQSVKQQSIQDFLCFVVDDGSSDDSVAVARSAIGNDARFDVVSQTNCGQLSVFNRAASECAEDDLIFFLDADDFWTSRHLENFVAHAGTTLASCDFLFSGRTNVTPEELEDRKGLVVPCEGALDLGTTSGLVRVFGFWIGNVTSCIAIRGRLLKRILPYEYEREWITRADDVLVLGSSIFGARKGYIDSKSVLYRIHGKNNFVNKTTANDPVRIAEHTVARERYVCWLCLKSSLKPLPSPALVTWELKGLPLWRKYCMSRVAARSALVASWPLTKRIEVFSAMRKAIRLARRR